MVEWVNMKTIQEGVNNVVVRPELYEVALFAGGGGGLLASQWIKG